ncbi:MAG TPA: cytochrome c [Epsilonproteobacteria bacterium]|nr:cytochrome c [Campylobacterota bacterium]HHE05990.1 cytochrome c [Campylobacterota bacterium]
MRYLCLLFPLFLYSEESFISHYEYGEMLYSNPRGVSCAECHGTSGEGKIIVAYQDIHGKEAIKGADIRRKTLNEMLKSVSSYHKIMPRYYLTNEEVEAIYDYLKVKNQDYLHSLENNQSR